MQKNMDYAQLLASLRSSRFERLRAAQAETLAVYAEKHFETRDLAIELPTGAGKSLIALLVGESWRREDKRVAILTGNKTLAVQMEREAQSLGIPSERMEGRGVDIPAKSKRSYHRSNAIAIMNYWVYFNQNPVIDPADLLLMDDAHLAEHCLHSLYSVEIDRHSHGSLFESVVTELSSRFPEYSVLQDALGDEVAHSTPTELMSFLDQSQVADRLREIVDASTAMGSDADLRFRWNRLRDKVRECNLYLSTNALWFRPYVYPLLANDHYRDVEQAIYMSATIGDPADLARRLGTRPATRLAVPEELAASTQGRRLIVMNRIEEEDIPARLQKAILAALSIHPKSVWLCSSRAEAEHFQKIVMEWLNAHGYVGHPFWLLTSLGDEIEQFKTAPKGHLFVGGRFDGMDFKASECRLVVLATIPRAINLQEEFFTAYMRDSGFMLRRLNHRIIQSLGRCNRAEDDYGVYVLADRRFATHFGRESNRVGVPGNIMAEIDCAEDATEADEDEVAESVREFLKGDFAQFDKRLSEAQKGVRAVSLAEKVESGVASVDEVIGWTELFASQNYASAASRFENCATAASKAGLRELAGFFRWCEAKATYLLGEQGEAAARNLAIDLMDQAINCGAMSAWFNRQRSSLNRFKGVSSKKTPSVTDYPYVVLHAFDDLLERVGPRGNRFQKWVEQGTALLSSESHGQFQEGLERLGAILGYSASRPRYGASTDCRWRGIFGNRREVITFEAKIEHEDGNTITPASVGQAHIQLARAIGEYEARGFIVRGTIVTHLGTIDASAQSSLGAVRVIRKSAIKELWDRVVKILSLYRDDWDLEDLESRMVSSEQVLPKLPTDGWLIKTLDAADAPFVDDLLAEWPH